MQVEKNSRSGFDESRFSEEEILQVNFMLNHLKTLDDKTDIIIKASNGILALVVGIVAFMIAFAPHKLGTLEILFVLVPISSILFSVVSSLLLLYPKFTQYVFFEKKRSFSEIEHLYHLSLRKKSSWIKLSVMGLIFGIVSFIGWFIYVAI